MSEPLFITYANNSLKEDPRNFYKIIKKIDDEFCKESITLKRSELHKELFLGFSPLSIESILRQIINTILTLDNDYKRAKNILINKKYDDEQRYGLEFTNPETVVYEVAFEAVFGYEDFYCITPCDDDINKKSFPFSEQLDDHLYIDSCAEYAPRFKSLLFKNPGDSDLFMSRHRITCYECEQLFFIEILKQIIDGTEYDKIPGFLSFLKTVEKWSVREIVFNESGKKKNPFKKNISEEYRWINPLNKYGNWRKGPNQNYPYKHIFNEFLRSIIALSLGDFLVFNDRRLLAICKLQEECNNFFIRANLRKDEEGDYYCKFCCDKHRWKNDNRKQSTKDRKKRFKEERIAKLGKDVPGSYID